MLKTLGIVEIQAPQTSVLESQAAASLAGRRFGNKSLLEWVVRRVTESLLLDQVVIVTTTDQADLVGRLAPSDVSVFVNDERDSLSRVAAAVREFDAEAFVRTSVYCPFVDPELIDRLVTTASANPEFDYIGYFSLDGRPAILSKVGFFAEWCRTEALHRADQMATKEAERRNALQYVYSHPELFQLRFIPIPEKLDRLDVRLTIEAEEDWDNAHLILEALGPERLDWRRIVSLLDQQPAIRQRMASLNAAGSKVGAT
jgi:spore coat polysaccharide biosynthesis protein SpsF